jgi:hypothetical protein
VFFAGRTHAHTHTLSCSPVPSPPLLHALHKLDRSYSNDSFTGPVDKREGALVFQAMAGIGVNPAYLKAQGTLAHSILSALRGCLTDTNVSEFIPNIDLQSNASACIDFASQNPVVGAFLPAGALSPGECLGATIASPSLDLCFVRHFFLMLSFLPDDMRENLTLMSIALYDMQESPAGGEASGMDTSADGESGMDGRGELELFGTVFPQHSTHPNQARRFVGTIFLVQERVGHVTTVGLNEFPLSDPAKIRNAMLDRIAASAASQEEGSQAANSQTEGGDEGVETASEPPSSQPARARAGEPPKKRPSPAKTYELDILTALKEVGLVWSKLAANETAPDGKATGNNSGPQAPLCKKMSDAVANGMIGGVLLARFNFTTLRAAAEVCVPPLFNVEAEEVQLDQEGYPLASYEYAEAMKRVQALDSDISQLYRMSLVWKVVRSRTGLPADVFIRSEDSGNKIYQGEYVSCALTQDDGFSPCPAFGGTAWYWTIPGKMSPFTKLFFVRIPGMHFIPPISPLIAQRHLVASCGTKFQHIIDRMEGLSEAGRINFVYHALFGTTFGNSGDDRMSYFRVNPFKTIISGYGALAGRDCEDFMEVMGNWCRKNSHCFDPANLDATMSAVQGLLNQFETSGGGRKGAAFMCRYPRGRHPNLRAYVDMRKAPRDDVFSDIHFHLMRDNGLMHDVASRSMLPFLAYAGSGFSAIIHLIFQGAPGSGKSILISILHALSGGACFQEFTEAVLRNTSAAGTWGCMIVPDELPHFVRAGDNSAYSTSSAKQAMNSILENKSATTMARGRQTPSSSYHQEITSAGPPHITFCSATNEELKVIDHSTRDRTVVEFFGVYSRPCETLRKLTQKDCPLDEKAGVDSPTTSALIYIAQVVRLKGFCQTLLPQFPPPLTIFVSPGNTDNIQRILVREGGRVRGSRISSTILEASIVLSCHNAVITSLVVDTGILRNKKDHALLAALVALASRFHIPTGVTYVQAASYMRDECETCTERQLLALVRTVLPDHPELLVDAWSASSVRIPTDIFNIADGASVIELHERVNYIKLSDTTHASLLADMKADTRCDDRKEGLVRFGKDYMDVNLSYLRKCFTRKEQDVLSEVCVLNFNAPLAQTLECIAETLAASAARELSTDPMRAVPESFNRAGAEDSLPAADAMRAAPESFDKAGSKDGLAGGGIFSALFQPNRPLAPMPSVAPADNFERWWSEVSKIMGHRHMSHDTMARLKPFLCRALVLLKEYVESFADMTAGGESLIRLQRRPYWDVSVDHIARHPSGLFGHCTIKFTADQLQTTAGDEGESMRVAALEALLSQIPCLRHAGAEGSGASRAQGPFEMRARKTRRAAKTFTLRLSDYRYILALQEQQETTADTLFDIAGSIGRLQVRVMFQDLTLTLYNKTTLLLEPVAVDVGSVGRTGARLVSDANYADAVLTIPNMTQNGPLTSQQLDAYDWVSVSEDGMHISARVSHLSDIVSADHGDRGGSTNPEMFLASLFLDASYCIQIQEGADVLRTPLGRHVVKVQRTDKERSEFLRQSRESLVSYMEMDTHPEYIGQEPCVEFKPGFLQILHERFRCVFEAIMTNGKCTVHGEALLRSIRSRRSQVDIESVEEIDRVIRLDECISKFKSRVLKEPDPKPKGHVKGSRAGDILDLTVQAARRQQQEKAAATATREAQIIAEAAAISRRLQPTEGAAGGEARGLESPGSPRDLFLRPLFDLPLAARGGQRETSATAVTVHTYLSTPSHPFVPSTRTFIFTAPYVCDLFERLLPPTGRVLKHLAGFTPFLLDNDPSDRGLAPPDTCNLARVPYCAAAVKFVTLGHESPFYPGEPLRLVYSPYTGTIRALDKTRGGILENPDAEVKQYQRMFRSFTESR